MSDWGDLVVRARGLSSHLLLPAQLASLSEKASLGAFAAQLASMQVCPAAPAGDPLDEHGIELALRRRASDQLGLLARWAGERIDLLAPIFDDEDRRTLRALLRGAVGGVPPEIRLRALIATPALPLRALEQLAHAGDISTIAACLRTWRHPFATALESEARKQHPDLLQLEISLARTFAERGVKAGGVDAAMALHVARTIDLSNLMSALVLASAPSELSPDAIFLDGGSLLTRADLLFAETSRSSDSLAARLAVRVRGTPLAAALSPGERSVADAALDAQLLELRRFSVRAPLGLAPVILFALRLRAELRALLRILWRLALGIPPTSIARSALGAA